MKIATWNVNSIRSRLERLPAWLQKNNGLRLDYILATEPLAKTRW